MESTKIFSTHKTSHKMETVNFDEFEFRPHYLGDLMTEAKGEPYKKQYDDLTEKYGRKVQEYANLTNKNTKTAEKLLESLGGYSDKIDRLKPLIHIPHLSAGCKSKLASIYTVATTGRTKNIKSKYFEKGLAVEEKVISLHCAVTGEFHKKNKERKSNGFLNGECDFVDETYIYDAKASWDIFTFDAVRGLPINPKYHWQGDGYMWLWDRPKFKLVYGLIDTPSHMVQREKDRLLYDFIGSKEDYEEACKEIDALMTYGDLTNERKHQVFEVERSEERIEMIKTQVPIWRYYLNNFGTFKPIEDENQNQEERDLED